MEDFPFSIRKSESLGTQPKPFPFTADSFGKWPEYAKRYPTG
jgi:hypothetical protein